MSTSQRVIKNSIFLYGKIAITSICLIFSTRYVLKGLGIEDFGIYNLICSTIVMLGFLNDSMTAATQRFMSYAEGAGKIDQCIKIFNSSYSVHLIIASIVAMLFIVMTPFVFGNYLQIPEERKLAAMTVYYFMIVTTCLNIITVPYNAVLIAHENMLYFSLIGIFAGVSKLFAAIGILYIPYDRLIAYGFLLLVVAFLEIVIIRLYCHSKYQECKIALRKNTDKETLKKMLSFAGWQMTYSASSILSIQGMSLILNSFYGTIMNAAQGISKQVCGQMMTLSGTMMSALNPVIVKYAGAQNQDGMIRAVMLGSKFAYFLAIIVALPLLFELPYLLDIWLTTVPDYAIIFCRYEVAQQIIASFTVALVTMVTGKGDIRGFQIYSSLTYLLRIPLIYLILKMGGNPESAYWITTATVIALCAGRIYFAHTKCALPVWNYISKVITPCLLVTLIVCVSLSAVVNVFEPSVWRLGITIGVSLLILITLFPFFALQPQERAMLETIVANIKRKIIKN